MFFESEYEGYFFLLFKKMVYLFILEYSYFYFLDIWNFFLKKYIEKKELSVFNMIFYFKKENDEIM